MTIEARRTARSTLASPAALDYDPWDPAFIADPDPSLARPRERAPALDDIEIDGLRIPRGQELALQFAAANRDPTAFERPDEIVLDRSLNAYLLFGAGILDCLGAPLAKVEFEILFRRILTDLPRLELVRESRRKPRFILRRLEALEVRA